MTLEELENLLEVVNGKNLRKMCKTMWPCIGVIEGSAYALSSLTHTVVAKFSAAYAEYYHDAESYADVAVMDHVSFQNDLKTAIDKAREQMAAQNAVNAQRSELEKEVEEKAKTMAEEMLANYVKSQQQSDVDMK